MSHNYQLRRQTSDGARVIASCEHNCEHLVLHCVRDSAFAPRPPAFIRTRRFFRDPDK